MNNIRKRIFYCLGLAAALMAGGCSDQWDDDDVSGTESLTLWEAISSGAYPELSSFRDALQADGMDQLLQSSGSYTVLAPVNAAMDLIPADKRSEVPGAHIALLEYNKSMLDTMTYLSMYNGKLVVLDSLHLEAREVICRNGVLRFAAYASTRQPNIYEALADLRADYDMADFILSLGDSIMDMERSLQIGVNEQNQPIYDTVMVYYNPLLSRVPLNNNDSLISLVLLDNDNFAALTAKYWPYLKQNDGQQPASLALDRTLRIDTAATDLVTKSELVCDLTCYLVNAVKGAAAYTSTAGIRITMDTATVTRVIDASNGNIQIASGVGIRLRDNKIKDVYIEGENYYYTNERYVYTRIIPSARGGKDVVVCGSDSVRSYTSYLKASDGSDSAVLVAAKPIYYYPGGYNATDYPQSNTRNGGPVLGYKAPMFSCNYKIYWRSVDNLSHHCKPDTTGVIKVGAGASAISYRYEDYLQNRNLPMAGVLRHIQKLYISQPGDRPLEYRDDYFNSDFVVNYTTNIVEGGIGAGQKVFCMADYDPEANLITEVGPRYGFARLGINAGFAVDDPTYESPLTWCTTTGPRPTLGATKARYYSGITGVVTNTQFLYNPITGAPLLVPNDIFISNYQGEATLFVTGAPFNEGCKGPDDDAFIGNPTASNNFNYMGSIFLDYIHLVPQVDE